MVIVAALRQSDGRMRVRVLPVTHTPPGADRGVAIPARVKRHLGLDAEASWIVVDELNEFVWPGPDLRPIARHKPDVWTFGVLPVELFAEVQAKIRTLAALRRVSREP